jgi:metal-responsive CopG/Arc/MetJ family transcriptional regulator
MSKAKITVTIEESLVEILDREARTLNASRSNLVETAIRTWSKLRLERELMEGYREMADENRRVAEECLGAGYEVMK